MSVMEKNHLFLPLDMGITPGMAPPRIATQGWLSLFAISPVHYCPNRVGATLQSPGEQTILGSQKPPDFHPCGVSLLKYIPLLWPEAEVRNPIPVVRGWAWGTVLALLRQAHLTRLSPCNQASALGKGSSSYLRVRRQPAALELVG